MSVTGLFTNRMQGNPDIPPNALVDRKQFVNVRLELFDFGKDNKGVSLELNLFDDTNLKAVRDRIERNKSGGFAWIGHIDGAVDSSVTLVVEDQRVSGTINMPDALYNIRHVKDNLHVVSEIDIFGLFMAEELAVANMLEPFESEVFNLVNRERIIAGLDPLRNDDRLTFAARSHSEDMAQQNYFSHTSLDGRTVGDRIKAEGYSGFTYGENIAAGFSTAEAVMNGWMNSPGHRANILNSNFCDIGVGYAPGGSFRHYWTQDFGCGADAPPTPTPTNTPTPRPTPSACNSDPKFQQTTVQNGATYYTDRTYTFTNVPSHYIGLDMIRALNAERNNTCNGGYMRFTLPEDAKVFIAYDRRATNLPNWMDGFTDTGDIINTSLSSQRWLKVYSKQFSANDCVDLGCNKGVGFSGGIVSNYCVFYGNPINTQPTGCNLDPKFQQTTVQNGTTYYTDRAYTFTNVPSRYIGLDMIRALNAERNNTCGSGYMRFALPEDAKVFVAYDRRATNLPNWMNGFTDTGDIINTSLSSQRWLKVYSKQFSANDCIDLGCNKGVGFSGGTVSNYCVFFGKLTDVSCNLNPKFEQTSVQNGMNYYTDRLYTFTSVPTFYIGKAMIKTPNNDRNNRCASGYVRFTKSSSGFVYVAYDRRHIALPNWMNGFVDTGDSISTSLSSQRFLMIFSKFYNAGECVDLGCNKGPGFSEGIKSNYIVITD